MIVRKFGIQEIVSTLCVSKERVLIIHIHMMFQVEHI